MSGLPPERGRATVQLDGGLLSIASPLELDSPGLVLQIKFAQGHDILHKYAAPKLQYHAETKFTLHCSGVQVSNMHLGLATIGVVASALFSHTSYAWQIQDDLRAEVRFIQENAQNVSFNPVYERLAYTCVRLHQGEVSG